MALKPCKECGHKVSKNAKTCPSCGAPIKEEIGCLMSGFIILMFLTLLIVLLNEDFKSPDEDRVNREQDRTKEQELINAEHFKNNRVEILKNGRDLIAKKQYSNAFNYLIKYRSMKNDELQALLKESEEMKLAQEVKGIPASKLEENRDIYAKLMNLNPDNQRYKKKHKFYQGKIETRDLKRKNRVAMFGEPPTPSAWDGTYFEVKDYLKKVLNDPESLDMDKCTKVFHTKKGWLVGCIYRGKNAFGGVVREAKWFTIRNNRVIQVHESGTYSWSK